MKKLLLKLAVAFLLIIGFNNAISAQVNAIYAGGAIHDFNQPISNVDELRNSGYNTVIVWTIHILEDGSLNLNFVNDLIDGNGNYIGDSRIIDRIRRLKQAPTSINRIEFGVGSASGQQFNVIRDYYQRDGGFPTSSPIYKSFKKLKETFPFVDAINNDDEVTYDVPSAVAFTKMLASLGFKNAIVPYRNASTYWGPLVQQVNQAYPGNVDRNYIQCYAGGSSNNPCQSQWNFGIQNIGGLWGGASRSSTSSVQNTMTGWKNSCGANGGFMWVYDDFVNPDTVNFDDNPTFSAVGYANAINNAFSTSSGGGGNTSGGGNAPNISRGKPFAVSGFWSAGFEGWRANDGNGTTRWASASTGQTQWIYYDLEEEYLIESVKIDWESAFSYDFNIQLWDGSQWVNVTGLTNNNQLSNGLGVNDVARYIRLISWRAPHNHISTWQFEVFGTPAGGGNTGGNTGGNNGGNNGGGSNATNVAAGKPFAVSSIYSAGFEGWRSNDTDRNTRWASSPTGTDQAHWVYYDLEAFYNISSVQLYFESAVSRDFNIQVWNGSAWVNQTGMTNNNNLSPGLGLNTTARYIRFISWRHQYNHVSLWEFEVYGTFSSAAKKDNGKETAPPELSGLLDDITQIKQLKVYPNPAKDNFNISLKGFKKADIIIADLLGKIVYQTTTANTKLNINKDTTFKRGIYIIKVVDENDNQHTSKLVIK